MGPTPRLMLMDENPFISTSGFSFPLVKKKKTSASHSSNDQEADKRKKKNYFAFNAWQDTGMRCQGVTVNQENICYIWSMWIISSERSI